MVRDLRKLKAAKHLREEVFFMLVDTTTTITTDTPHSTQHLRTPVWYSKNPLEDNKYKTKQIENTHSSFPPLHLSKIKI